MMDRLRKYVREIAKHPLLAVAFSAWTCSALYLGIQVTSWVVDHAAVRIAHFSETIRYAVHEHENSVEWIDGTRKEIGLYRAAIVRQSRWQEGACPNPAVSEHQRYDYVQMSGLIELVGRHNKMVRRYNTVVLRFAAGSQYRGVEEALPREVQPCESTQATGSS